MPALVCVQRRAKKRVSAEDDFIKSNIDSFGNDIGQTTNWITSMFEVRAGFDSESKEYSELTYRIMCGQLFQQNAIDKAKGIISKPMPSWWHDRHAIKDDLNTEDSLYLNSIVADKKPYFMRYIYPSLSKQYNTYVKNTNEVSLRRFGKTVAELLDTPIDELSVEQSCFLKTYRKRIPVGMNECVMNKICRRIEKEFDGCIVRYSGSADFDYTFMKTGAQYSHNDFVSVRRLYEAHSRRIKSYTVHRHIESVDPYEAAAYYHIIDEEFREECEKVCPDAKALCDIVLDMCYTKSSTKSFTWNMCGEDIVENLVSKNSGVIHYPTSDPNGDISYGGSRFSVAEKKVG